MVIDPGVASIVAAILLFAGTYISVNRAGRKGKQQGEEQAAVEEEVSRRVRGDPTFSETMQWTAYIREQVDQGVQLATKDIREELDDVKQIVVSLHGRLRRIRQAVREWVADVRRTWGRSPEPPPLPAHIAELIDEDEEDDTLTMARIRRIAQSAAAVENETEH